MSSTYESRDKPNCGNEPTVPLGYPAVVRYTFTPQTTEFNELFVSEGDIVQLLYSVGGWVYVKTYTGQTGYIPIQYCLTLHSSKRLSTLFDDVGSDANQAIDAGDPKKQPDDVPGHLFQTLGRSETYGKLFSEKPINYVSNLGKKPPTYVVPNTNGHIKQSGQIVLNCDNISERPPTFPPGFDLTLKQNKIGTILSDNYLNGKTIPEFTFNGTYCRFLSQIVLTTQNLAITDREKADLKSRKLLRILKLASKESSNHISVIRPTTERDKVHYAEINKSEGNIESISRIKGEVENNQCPYCNILTDYFKDSGEISMSDLYSTIRNLHLHALSDSDSDNELNPIQNASSQIVHESNGSSQDDNGYSTMSNGCLSWASDNSSKNGFGSKRNSESSPKSMKRSVSFQLQERKDIKPEITRNQSFSGRTSLETESAGNQFQYKGGSRMKNGFEKENPVKRPNVPPAYDRVFTSECECSNSVSEETNNNHKPHCYENNITGNLTNGNDPNFSERLSNSDFPFSKVHDTSYSGSVHSEVMSSRTETGTGNSPKHNKLAESALHLLNSQARIYERTKHNVNDGNISSASNSSESIHVQMSRDSRDLGDTQNNHIRNNDAHFVSDITTKNTQNSINEYRGNHDTQQSVPTNHNRNHETETVQQSRSTHDRKSVLEYRSNHNKQPVTFSQRPLNKDGNPKKFQQLNFYGLASLSNNHNASVKEPAIPPESAKYNTWGGKTDKKKIIARRLQIPGSPKENGPLSPRPDDKDIRKSLQGLSTVKKGPVKAQPMRAEHSIQVQNADSTDKLGEHKGRTVLVKKFNKQMWRAPSGVPEGSDQRPFSPFGGTLPPSKIVKKKVVEVFV